MRVLITGGSGSVGRAVVERLASSGFSVLVIGRRADISFENAEYQVCDVSDFPRLREVVQGCDAVIHLAAIPTPGKGRPEEIFHANAQGTFNVFQAAAEAGIRRVVQASSINATGQFYGVKPAPLLYLPIDEAHPTYSTDAYSFSKNVIEEIGAYFWRREGISSVAFRLPWVAPAGHHEKIGTAQARAQEVVGRLMEKTAVERRDWFEQAWEKYNNFRATRPYEREPQVWRQLNELPQAERDMFWAMGHRVNFFTMLDERDSAQAVEKGLTADFSGSHALFINDSRNWTGIESRTLATLFYPDVTSLKTPLEGTESLVSIDRARALIGFEPEFSFL